MSPEKTEPGSEENAERPRRPRAAAKAAATTAVEPAATEALDEILPSSGLLSFYDRLREKVVRTVEMKGGKLGSNAAQALLLVPDDFMLLVRLALDREVPKGTRAVIAGTLAYFVLPLDLFPEGLVGGVGYMEDLVLAAAVLSQAFGGELEPYARRYWSGRQELRVILKDITEGARVLLGENLYKRFKRAMGRRGVKI